MSVNLRVGLIAVALLLLVITLLTLKKEKMPVRYSLVWLLSSIIILLLAIIPDFFALISHLLGFVTVSNMVIGIFIFLLLMITIVLTVIVSNQQKKITLLIQEVSMLKANDRND